MGTQIMNIYLPWAIRNFSFSMFLVAFVFALCHKLIRRGTFESEIVYRWMAFFGLGFTCLFAFIVHAYYPVLAATSIGWENSPFQFEVATADLAFGVLGILSFSANFGFRLATVIGATIWLWGDAIGHIGQMVLYHNFSIGNAGTWFWMDVALPFILILCLLTMHAERKILA